MLRFWVFRDWTPYVGVRALRCKEALVQGWAHNLSWRGLIGIDPGLTGVCKLWRPAEQNIHLFDAVFVYARGRCDRRSGGIRLITAKDGHYPAELRGLVVELYNHCRAYMVADDRQAWWQLMSTFALFLPLMALMYWLQPLDNPWALLLAIPNGALLVRIFALQHDCGHGSFFSSKRMNETVGQIISVLTFTPYDHWRRSHAVHHAGSGNLERRGIGDIETLTIAEFEKLSRRSGKRSVTVCCVTRWWPS